VGGGGKACWKRRGGSLAPEKRPAALNDPDGLVVGVRRGQARGMGGSVKRLGVLGTEGAGCVREPAPVPAGGPSALH
jgi:hypothetical protein